MMSSKDFVPNPDKWIRFFKKGAEKNFEPYTWGKGIIPIDGGKPKAVSTGRLKIEAVTPAQQTVEQAKSELLRKTTTILRKQRGSGKRIFNSKTATNLKQTVKGNTIYNKQRQIAATKEVPIMDMSVF